MNIRTVLFVGFLVVPILGYTLRMSSAHCKKYRNLRNAGIVSLGTTLKECGDAALGNPLCSSQFFQWNKANGDCGCATDNCGTTVSSYTWSVYSYVSALTLHEVTDCNICGQEWSANLCQDASVSDQHVGNDQRAAVGSTMTLSDCTRMQSATQAWHNSEENKYYFVYDPYEYWYSHEPCPAESRITKKLDCLLAKPALSINNFEITTINDPKKPAGCIREGGNEKIEFNINTNKKKADDETYSIICRNTAANVAIGERSEPLSAAAFVFPSETEPFDDLTQTVTADCHECWSDSPSTGLREYVVNTVTSNLAYSAFVGASLNAVISFFTDAGSPMDQLRNEMTHQDNKFAILDFENDIDKKADDIQTNLQYLSGIEDKPFEEPAENHATNPRCYDVVETKLSELCSDIRDYVKYLQIVLRNVYEITKPQESNMYRGHLTTHILQMLPYLIQLSMSSHIAWLEAVLKEGNSPQRKGACQRRFDEMAHAYAELDSLYQATLTAAKKWIFTDCHDYVETDKGPKGWYKGIPPGNCERSQFGTFEKEWFFFHRYYCGTERFKWTWKNSDNVHKYGRRECAVRKNILIDAFDGKFGPSSIIAHRFKTFDISIQRLQNYCDIREMVSPKGRHTPMYYYMLSYSDEGCRTSKGQLATCVLEARTGHGTQIENDQRNDQHGTDYCGIPTQNIDTTNFDFETSLPQSIVVMKSNFTIP